jgi:hypothetical protein
MTDSDMEGTDGALLLTRPQVERHGDDYSLSWPDQVSIKVCRIYQHRDYNVDAEVEIFDYSEANPQLLQPIRTSLTKTFRGLLADLKEVSYREDWKHRLTQMAFYCLQQIRAGEPIIDLNEREAPDEPRETITDIAWEGMPTVLYGAGGVGKSILALAFANTVHNGMPIDGLQSIRGNALILDYETSWDETWRRSAHLLTGAGIEGGRKVYYRFCSAPLSQDIQSIKRQISELDISFVVVDSVGPACGGDPELAGPTIQYFTALRTMSSVDRPVTTISVAHVRKNESDSGGPYGSVYWTNFPRAVYHVKKIQRANANFVDVGLYHEKTNVGKILEPKSFRLTWSDGIRIESIRAEDTDLSVLGKLSDRAYGILRDGPGKLKDLAEELGVGERSLSSTLSNDPRFQSAVVNLNGVNGRAWQIKSDIDLLG